MVDPSQLYNEMQFSMSRSSGAGGQHVNKVETRVELRFDIAGSQILTSSQKSLLMNRLTGKLTKDGVLIIASERTRSQSRNKADCVEKFHKLLEDASKPRKKRIATRPSLRSRKKRLENKKRHAQKKQDRKKPDL